MAEIVKEADLSAGAVYVYYASKGDLMIDVARRVMEPRLAVLKTAQSQIEVPEPHVVFVELLDSLLDNPFSSVLVQVWGEASYDEEFASFVGTIFEALLEQFTDYLAVYLRDQRGIESESARAQAAALVPAILAMLQGAVVQATVFGDSSRQRVRAGIEGVLSRFAL